MKDKYKIIRKVREHKRKLRKEARKNPRRKTLKDPGIPNNYPEKKALLQYMAAQEELKKEDQRQEQTTFYNNLKRKREEGEEEIPQLIPIEENDKSLRSLFIEEFKEVVNNSDIIIQVLDMRNPLGTRCIEIEDYINSLGKSLILLLNKIDLVPKENVELWLKYLRNEYPTLLFKSSIQKQRKRVFKSRRKKKKVNFDVNQNNDDCSDESHGVESLIAVLKNYYKNLELKKNITVSLIGFPNVGKSSIIETIIKSKTQSLEVDEHLDEVIIDKHINLIDSISIIIDTNNISNIDSALNNLIYMEEIEDPIPAVEEIINKCEKEKLAEIYKIGDFDDVMSFLDQVGQKKGPKVSGGVTDINATALLVLNDWNLGKFKYYTIPPNLTVVDNNLDKGFNLESIADIEMNIFDKLKNDSYNYITFEGKIINLENILTEEIIEDSDEEMIEETKEDINEEQTTEKNPIKTKKEKLKREEIYEKPKKKRKLNNGDNKKSDNTQTQSAAYDFNVDFWE